jgi:ABC-type Na+ efflux pump permease subunit
LKRFKQIAWIFIKKDWFESRKPIAVLTCGLLVSILAFAGEFENAMITGLLMAASFIYAQSCFSTERRHGTLEFLLALPVTRLQLVLAKYASLFSMALFTVSVPGLFLDDFSLLIYGNLLTLFLSTLFMAATIISDKPWAAQLPLWLVIAATLPFHGSPGFTRISGRTTLLALGALLVAATILASACVFAREPRQFDDRRSA